MNRIILENASFQYSPGTWAVENLNLTIDQGEAVAIVGQNGAGKTTAVKMMNGLYKPVKGRVWVNGVDTREKTTAQIAALVGYVFQNPDDQIFNATVHDEIAYMPRYLKLSDVETERRVAAAVELTGIGPYLNYNPFDIPYSIRKFVAIAAILATHPRYMILDEPTAGQDLIGTRTLNRLIRYLRSEDVTVITISHDMEFVAENFERVVAMAHRRILFDGRMEELFANDVVLRECRIKKPQIARLADLLGYPPGIIFRDQLRQSLRSQLGKGERLWMN